MSNRDADVILACLKLARAMRRIPPERREYPFPPAVGRLLDCAAKNPGVSSRELCEFLDVRPSFPQRDAVPCGSGRVHHPHRR